MSLLNTKHPTNRAGISENVHPSTARLAIDLMLNGGAGDRDAAEIVADYQDLDAGSGLWVDPREVSGFIVAPNEHLGTAREIAPLDDIKAWHKSSFSTAATTVVAAGSAELDVISKELDLLFAKMPDSQPAEPVDFPQPTVPGKTILMHKPDAEKTAVIVLGNFPPHSQEHDIPLQLGVGVLGHGKHSRLFKTVRAGLGASYGFGAEVFNFTQEHRFIEMTGEIETEQLSVALDEIEKAYAEFKEDGIGRVEFPLAKRFFKREVQKQLNNPIAMAFSVSSSVKNGFAANYAYKLLDYIDSTKRALENACVIEKLEELDSCL